MDSPIINYCSFCTGIGWLDIAYQLACEYVGLRTRCVFACEWEANAAETLRSRMEDSSLESAPIWCGDLRQVPIDEFRGVVGAAVFGFPCQDISQAGQGAGIRGERSGVFFDILQTCCDLGCELLYMENVSAITTRGLDIVSGALAEVGFHAEWAHLSAAAVEASHKRERWFCLAYRHGERRQQDPRSSHGDEAANERRATEHDYEPASGSEGLAIATVGGQRELRQSPGRNGQSDGSRVDVADAVNEGWGEGQRRTGINGSIRERDGNEHRLPAEESGSDLVNATCERAQVAHGVTSGTGEGVQQLNGRDTHMGYAGGQRRQAGHVPVQRSRDQSKGRQADVPEQGCGELGNTKRNGRRAGWRPETEISDKGQPSLFAPGPQSEHWGRIIQDTPHLAPAIEPGFCVLADGWAWLVDESRADQLRCSGNAVVVLQAAVAYVGLMRRIGLTK